MASLSNPYSAKNTTVYIMPVPISVEVALQGPPNPSGIAQINKLNTAAAKYVDLRAIPNISAIAINNSIIVTDQANRL